MASVVRPTWDSTNHRSEIRVKISNIGKGSAGRTLAQLTDPSTPQSSGHNPVDVKETPALEPGGVAVVTFYLNYAVFNPNASLRVTASYNNQLAECNETNNVKKYEEGG